MLPGILGLIKTGIKLSSGVPGLPNIKRKAKRTGEQAAKVIKNRVALVERSLKASNVSNKSAMYKKFIKAYRASLFDTHSIARSLSEAIQLVEHQFGSSASPVGIAFAELPVAAQTNVVRATAKQPDRPSETKRHRTLWSTLRDLSLSIAALGALHALYKKQAMLSAPPNSGDGNSVLNAFLSRRAADQADEKREQERLEAKENLERLRLENERVRQDIARKSYYARALLYGLPVIGAASGFAGAFFLGRGTPPPAPPAPSRPPVPLHDDPVGIPVGIPVGQTGGLEGFTGDNRADQIISDTNALLNMAGDPRRALHRTGSEPNLGGLRALDSRRRAPR